MGLIDTTYRYCFFLLCSLLFTGTMLAQERWDSGDYDGIPRADKQNIFFDEFENNQYRWELKNHDYRREHISNGDMYCSSKSNAPFTKRRTVVVDWNGNYEIEVRMRYVKGSDLSMAGLSFGRNFKNSQYQFLFNARGTYAIYSFDRGRERKFKTGKPLQSIHKYAYKTLTVRKVAEKWYFFLNEELVHQTQARPFYGNLHGITIGGNMDVEVDYFRVSELQSADLLGPQISVLEPLMTDNQDHVYLNARHQYISGKLHDESQIKSLLINGYPISVNAKGEFRASLTLRDEPLKIELTARDIYGNINSRVFYMQYQEPDFTPPPIAQNKPQSKGKNYILVIGINNYSQWNPLHNAVKDCRDLVRTLTTYYEFEPENVSLLFNEEATRESILETLEDFQEEITPDDNLLIYYAGHGYYNASSELGYWVPVDARLNKVPDFIPNSTIHDYLTSINSRNTLLIADACYAGSLLSKYRGTIVKGAKSRWAFTSGDVEKVWDGQPGQNSPFAAFLISYLKNSPESELRADELIDVVTTQVRQNTTQTPVGSPLKSAGNEGGVFVFYRK